MRSFCVLFLFAACNPQPQPATAPPAASCQPLPGMPGSAEPSSNSSPLVAEALPSPSSQASLRITRPELGEEITIADPRSYQVGLVSASLDADALGFDVALDAERPRRLPVAQSTIALGKLSHEGSELSAGPHWLFAAPVMASGLVPRSAAGKPRAAVARRFFVGKRSTEQAGPSAEIWLRKPEGTYNGSKNSERILFDAFVFSAAGAALDIPCTIAIRAPGVTGEMRLPAPFSVHDAPSGEYELGLSAASASPVTARFTVNRELGNPP